MAKRPLMADADASVEEMHRTSASPFATAREPAEAGGEGEWVPALDEILRHVRYLTGRVEEAAKRKREPLKDEAHVPAGATDASESGNVKSPIFETPAEIVRALEIQRADFGRWVEGERRARRRWRGLAVAAGFPAALMLGVLVQLQFQAIPPHDPTGGWRGHIWENYGRTIVDCAVEAMRTNAEVDCPLVVRRP